MQPQEQEGATGDWVEGEGLWRVAFLANSLKLIQHLSGLVEIQATYFDAKDDALVMIVKEQDRTNTLFRGGKLRAVRVQSYRESGQGIYAERATVQ